MSITNRKPRPLVRELESFRDDRLFIIASDDTYAPKQYFEAFNMPRIKVLVIPTTDGSSAAQHVLARLEGYELFDDDERWMLLDTDHYIEASHAASYIQAIAAARQKGVNVALSRPCFDFWLLLHHLGDVEKLKGVTDAKSVGLLLRETLGEFNKTKIDTSKYSFKEVLGACLLARQMDETVSGGDRPTEPTSRVYLLWESLLSKTQVSQMSADLLMLANTLRKNPI